MPRVTRIAALAVPLTLLLAACSAETAPSKGSSSVFAPAHAPAAQAPAAQPAQPGTAGGGQSLDFNSMYNATTNDGKSIDTTLSLGTPQGRIERSVTVAFVVPHNGFLDAFDALIERADSLGGYVLSSSTSPGDGGRIDRGSLVVRVPSAKLNAMVTGMPRGWQTSSIDYGSVDHTAETIDLTARVKAITAHRNALQKLLDNTTNLNDITSLENQLADVQQQLDQVQGQLDSVNDHVDMATATISLREKGAAAPPAPSPTPRLVSALHDGWNNAIAVIGAVTLGVFSGLPLLVLAGIALLVWLRLRLRPLRVS